MTGRDERVQELKDKAKAGTLTKFERGELRARTRDESSAAFAVEDVGDNVDAYDRGRERARANRSYTGSIADALTLTETETVLKNWREGR